LTCTENGLTGFEIIRFTGVASYTEPDSTETSLYPMHRQTHTSGTGFLGLFHYAEVLEHR